MIHRRSATNDLPGHVDIAPGGVGVGTDYLVGFLGERREFGLRHAPVLYVELDREPEAAALARPDPRIGSQLC